MSQFASQLPDAGSNVRLEGAKWNAKLSSALSMGQLLEERQRHGLPHGSRQFFPR
jgi:hypothetical protein